MLDLITQTAHHVSLLADTLPDPTPKQPPGTKGINKLINWVDWGVLICGLLGFLISAGLLAFAALSGREVNHAKGLGISIFVCILATAAASILRVFI